MSEELTDHTQDPTTQPAHADSVVATLEVPASADATMDLVAEEAPSPAPDPADDGAAADDPASDAEDQDQGQAAAEPDTQGPDAADDAGDPAAGGGAPDTTQDEPEADLKAEHAMVFVGGLGQGLTNERTFTGVVDRVKRSCDKQAHDRTSQWAIEWHAVAGDSPDPYAKRATIMRSDGDADPTPAIDIYEFLWAPGMVDRWKQMGLPNRAVRSGVGLWSALKLTAGLFFKRSLAGDGPSPVGASTDRPSLIDRLKRLVGLDGSGRARRRRRGQALVSLIALLCMVAYVLITAAAALSAIVSTREMWGGEVIDAWAGTIQWLALVLTAVVTFFVPRLRGNVGNAGASLFAAGDYVRLPSEPARIAGQFSDALEQIGERDGHEQVDVIAYSFGCLVTFDVLFPHTAPPVRSLHAIDRVVLIGAPFAWARAIRKTFFSNRQTEGPAPTKLTTVWSYGDLLSSPRPIARRTSQPVELGRALEVKEYNVGMELTIAGILSFHGFSNHGIYWGLDGAVDRNVFETVVDDLYAAPRSTILAAAGSPGEDVT